MAKATVQRLKDEGWRADQFGGALDVPAFDAYLQAAIDEAGRWAAAKCGAAYAGIDSPSYAFDCLARAETCAASAQLWKRRAAFIDSGASSDRQNPLYLERREYLAHGETAWACALANLTDALGEIGVDPTGLGDWTAFATGTVESGRYPVAAHG